MPLSKDNFDSNYGGSFVVRALDDWRCAGSGADLHELAGPYKGRAETWP